MYSSIPTYCFGHFNEEAGFEDMIEDIAEIKSSGHDLDISCITHFELL